MGETWEGWGTESPFPMRMQTQWRQNVALPHRGCSGWDLNVTNFRLQLAFWDIHGGPNSGDFNTATLLPLKKNCSCILPTVFQQFPHFIFSCVGTNLVDTPSCLIHVSIEYWPVFAFIYTHVRYDTGLEMVKFKPLTTILVQSSVNFPTTLIHTQFMTEYLFLVNIAIIDRLQQWRPLQLQWTSIQHSSVPAAII